MKTLDEQDHYEVLEVPWGARSTDIDRAYRMARSAWAPESLALYSMFDESDAEVIRARIEQAHHVLSDEERRAEYDARLLARGVREPEAAGPPVTLGGDPGESVEIVVAAASERAADPATALHPFDDIDAVGFDEDEEEGEWTGARLRRARLRRGIELEEIGDTTKVSLAYLRSLEEDRFDDLPALVYVRGFVSAYARALGLDPQATAASYMRHVDASTRKSPRSRLLART